MANTDTTAVAAAFGGSSQSEHVANGDNKPESGFKALMSEAFRIGKAQGVGDTSRLAILDMFRVGALEHEIPYVEPKKGRKAKGAVDDTPVGQLSARYIAGITKGGGNESKATQKNRFNQVVAWCAGPDTREQDAVWQRAMEQFKNLEALGKSDKTVKVFQPAEIMLRISALYTKKGGDVNRTTPLTDEEIEKCIRRVAKSKEFASWLKNAITTVTEELDAQGGDSAEEEYKAALASLNALQTMLTAEYTATETERKRKLDVAALVANGTLVPNKNGKGYRLAA